MEDLFAVELQVAAGWRPGPAAAESRQHAPLAWGSMGERTQGPLRLRPATRRHAGSLIRVTARTHGMRQRM